MAKRDAFFEKLKEMRLALTFGDLRLQTNYSEVLPSAVNTASLFSRNVGLKIPIVSAPMDTVTTSRLATELAKFGGLGIIHRYFSSDQQCAEVTRVKNHLNALISSPIFVYSDQTMGEIEKMRASNNFTFHSLPVLDHSSNVVMGILTADSFEFRKDSSLTAKERMREFPSAPVSTTIEEAYRLMDQCGSKVLVLADKEGLLAGLYLWSDVKAVIENNRGQFNVDKHGRLCVGAAIGVGNDAIDQAFRLQDAGADVIVIDSAHGDSKGVIDTLISLKRDSKFMTDMVVGNISRGEAARRLVDAGADGIKIGQGGGSICTTRIIAGIGRPQATAIHDCEIAIRDSGVPVCGDGGIVTSGDITIALGCGARSVMVGRMLAGTDESPGDIVTVRGVKHKSYRGMGSLGAMRDNPASRERYGQTMGKPVPEGVEGAVPYQGSLADVLDYCVGGFPSWMGYLGVATIEELREKADFDWMTQSGVVESSPHDIVIIAEAPNYQGGQR